MDSKTLSKKELSHQRIVAAASKAIRRAGFRDVSVGDVMKEAGLTHGGFYAHFPSRDALLAEALVHASQESGALIKRYVEMLSKADGNRFRAFIEAYLSDGQITDCENGCPVAALCSEMRHQEAEVLDSSRQAVINLRQLVQEVMPSDCRPEAVWMVAGAMIGALQMARIMGDNEQGRAVLAAARTELIARYGN